MGVALRLTGDDRNTLKQLFRTLLEQGQLVRRGDGRESWLNCDSDLCRPRKHLAPIRLHPRRASVRDAECREQCGELPPILMVGYYMEKS